MRMLHLQHAVARTRLRLTEGTGALSQLAITHSNTQVAWLTAAAAWQPGDVIERTMAWLARQEQLGEGYIADVPANWLLSVGSQELCTHVVRRLTSTTP
jgi:hypothetical protein